MSGENKKVFVRPFKEEAQPGLWLHTEGPVPALPGAWGPFTGAP